MPNFLFSLSCVLLTFLGCLIFSFLAFKIIEKTLSSKFIQKRKPKREVFFVTNVKKAPKVQVKKEPQTFKGTLLSQDEFLAQEYDSQDLPFFSSKRSSR